MNEDRRTQLNALIRDVPDFPKPGIVFKDITPLLADPDGLKTSIDLLAEACAGKDIDAIVGIESRGFIFGTALAVRLGVSFVPVRKPGKLPAATDRVEYALEYGTDALEIHQDALGAGNRVLIVDDLLATGGTAAATGKLVANQGALVAGYAFLIELTFLAGRDKLGDTDIHALLTY